MASEKFLSLLCGLLAILATALCVWFGTALHPWWPLMWFAPLPALLFATRSSWPAAGLVAALGWAIGGMNVWHVLAHNLELPAIVVAAVVLIPSLVFVLVVLLFRALVLRGAFWTALLAFPSAWVSAEYLNNLSSVHGTFGNLAYSQMKFLPLLQVASLAGPWGMSFLLLLFPAALAIAFHLRKRQPGTAWRISVVSLAVIALALAWGALRLARPEPGPRVKVGLIASDEPRNRDIASSGADTARLFSEYAAAAQDLAARGAQVIVMPEKIGVVVDPETRVTDDFFQSLAEKTKTTIVVGMVRVNQPLMYNEARVYAPAAPVRSYDKQHLLPPFESQLTPGTALTMMTEPSGIWGILICKDLDFTQLSRRYGAAQAGLMLVPAWDFAIDRTWHGHMALMRGVESGFSIDRAAKLGYLTLSDDRGRILAESQSDVAPFTTLLADVPVHHDATLFVFLGDWFAWVATAIFAISIVRCFTSRKPAN